MDKHETGRAEIRTRFGAFIEECVNSGLQEREKLALPLSRDLMKAAADIGLATLLYPQAVNGSGLSLEAWGVTLQEIGYLSQDAAFPALLGYRGAVGKALFMTGREDLIERYVRPMVRGDLLGSFAYTEGNDPFSFQTTATETAEGYVVNGRKVPIAGGMTSDVFLTFVAREDGDLMVVLLERDDPGVSLVPFEAVGLRSLGLATLTLDKVKIGRERVIVPKDGLSFAQRFLNLRRLTVPCWVLGRMEALFERCVADLSSKIRYGLPLTEMQTIQAAMGRIYTAIESARLVLGQALKQPTSAQFDPYWDRKIAMSKYYVVQQALEVCRTAQSVVGGTAVFSGSIYERCMRDFHCLMVMAGTQATLEVDLGVMAIHDLTMKCDS